MLKDLLEKKLYQAKKGREDWLELIEKKYIKNETYVILFPQNGTSCNKYILKYLPVFSEKLDIKHILILSHDDEVLENIKSYNNLKCDSIFWSREKAEEIMAYYMLQKFTNQLIIASLDEPEGRNGNNIIGVKGITEEEAVAIGILGLKSI